MVLLAFCDASIAIAVAQKHRRRSVKCPGSGWTGLHEEELHPAGA